MTPGPGTTGLSCWLKPLLNDKKGQAMNAIRNSLLALTAAVSLAACSTDQYGNRSASRPLAGAGIGAAGGAAVGALTGGNVVAGAAIGAAAGAVIGAVTDDRNRYEDRDGYRTYYESNGRPYRYDRNGRKRYVRR